MRKPKRVRRIAEALDKKIEIEVGDFSYLAQAHVRAPGNEAGRQGTLICGVFHITP
jgi:hypothetical protein